jgi:RNA polymerase sigma-70 factor (ECF subfamily)
MTELVFPELRRLMFSIAYRMLGSVAEAEDIVQEAFLRLHRASEEGVVVESRKAYLATVTTRLAIDYLRSARAQRESYVGTWLPEPLIGDMEPSAARRVEMAESLSMAFLLILETLSPTERAVFLLREVFDYGYGEIAAIVEKNEDNCRQIFTRAKRHIEAGRPRFEPSTEKRDEFAERFFEACRSGDMDGLVNMLASDVVFYGDGGGKATAVGHPVEGPERVARLLLGLFKKGIELGFGVRPVEVNGQPGAMTFDTEHRLISVLALEVSEGIVSAVRAVVNPDKLRHLGPLSDAALRKMGT